MSRSVPSSVWRLLAVALSVLILAACSDEGGGGGTETGTETPSESEAPATVDAETYAATVCGAVSDWMASIEDNNATLQDDLGTDLDAVKEKLLGFLDDTIAATDTMLDEIGSVGAPDVVDGEAFHQEIQDVLASARTAFQDARDAIDGLDTSDPTALGEGLQEVGTSLQTAFDDVENPLQSIEGSELGDAFDANETCSSLDEMAA